MREIKFRAWDKKRKIFMPQGEIIFSDYGDTRWSVNPNALEYIHDECNECDRFELMQYTGLKDKNGVGVEMYDKDIVSDGSGARRWIVGIDPIKGTTFALIGQESFVCGYDYFSDFHKESMNIIGNIYEHSYLLNNL